MLWIFSDSSFQQEWFELRSWPGRADDCGAAPPVMGAGAPVCKATPAPLFAIGFGNGFLILGSSAAKIRVLARAGGILCDRFSPVVS